MHTSQIFTSGSGASTAHAAFVPQHLSEKGLEFIARWEGCVLHPYNDAVGYATIGVGHLIAYKRVEHLSLDELKLWHNFTYPKAIALLKKDAARFELAVRNMHLHLSQPQFDALCSFAFNLGPGCLSQLASHIKVGNWNAMLAYDHAGGHVLEGLQRRRQSEVHLAVHGTYNF